MASFGTKLGAIGQAVGKAASDAMGTDAAQDLRSAFKERRGALLERSMGVAGAPDEVEAGTSLSDLVKVRGG